MKGRKIGGFGAVIAALLALTACGSSSGTTNASPTAPDSAASGYQPSAQGVLYIKLPDGYDLLCVYVRHYEGGGPDCDWEGYHDWLAKQ